LLPTGHANTAGRPAILALGDRVVVEAEATHAEAGSRCRRLRACRRRIGLTTASHTAAVAHIQADVSFGEDEIYLARIRVLVCD
jgi:hypothetical protein